MIILLSPSKKLDDKKTELNDATGIPFPSETEKLISNLKKKSLSKIRDLMNLSDKLAELNKSRYENFEPASYTPENSNPAIYEFRGDVFVGLDVDTLEAKDIDYAQDHLRILSGLYGILRPKDLIQPYRLEMGTNLKVGRQSNLYGFWGDKLTDHINTELKDHGDQVLYNLASNEYAKAVKLNKIEGRVIEFTFKEWRKEKWSFISFNAKKARGYVARHIIQNRITNPEDLKAFDVEGYQYVEELSSQDHFFFGRY